MSYADVMRVVDMRTRQNAKRNNIPVNLNESTAHLYKKVEVCFGLRKNGKEFYVECIFSGGKGRADILWWGPDDGDIGAIEIVHTEDIETSGKSKYPVPVEFVNTSEMKSLEGF